MPATKNDRNEPVPPLQSGKSQAGEGAFPGSLADRWKAARSLLSPRRHDPPPAPASSYDETDLDVAFDFLLRYQALGRALVKAGYIRPHATPALLQPDWERFAQHIQERFHPEADAALEASVDYMLYRKDLLALRNEQIDAEPLWETYSVDDDGIWLARLIQRIAGTLLHQLRFVDTQACDIDLVCSAAFVLIDWAALDPDVEKYLEEADWTMD